MSEGGEGIGYDGFPETKKQEAEFKLQTSEKKVDQFIANFDTHMAKRFAKLRDKDQSFLDEAFAVIGSQDAQKIQELKDNTLEDRREFVDWLVELNTEFDDLKKTRDFLDEKYSEYVREEVETIVLDIIPRVDYDTALDVILTQEHITELDEFTKSVNYLREVQFSMVADDEEPPELSTFQLGNVRDRLIQIKEDFTRSGYLKKGIDGDFDYQDVSEEPNLVMKTVNLKSQTNALMESVRAYPDMARYFVWASAVYSNVQAATLSAVSEKLSDVYNKETYNSEDKLKRPDPRFLTAISGWLKRQTEKYESNGVLPITDKTKYEKQKYLNSLDKEQILANIKIIGFDAPSVSFKTESVKTMLKTMIPASILLKITSIQVFEGRAMDSPRYAGRAIDETSMIAGTCFYDFDYNEGELKGAAVEIYNTDATGKLSESENRHTIWHEIGHVAHQDMTPAEIQEWLDIEKAEVFRLTAYVPVDGEKRHIEDFTENFTYFVDQPTLLKVLAPKRYEFMKKFIESRCSDDEKIPISNYIMITQLIQDAQWKIQGLTEDEIREIWVQTVPQN